MNPGPSQSELDRSTDGIILWKFLPIIKINFPDTPIGRFVFAGTFLTGTKKDTWVKILPGLKAPPGAA